MIIDLIYLPMYSICNHSLLLDYRPPLTIITSSAIFERLSLSLLGQQHTFHFPPPRDARHATSETQAEDCIELFINFNFVFFHYPSEQFPVNTFINCWLFEFYVVVVVFSFVFVFFITRIHTCPPNIICGVNLAGDIK